MLSAVVMIGILWVNDVIYLLSTAVNVKRPKSQQPWLDQRCSLFGDYYSKTCVKQPLKNRQNKDLKDKW